MAACASGASTQTQARPPGTFWRTHHSGQCCASPGPPLPTERSSQCPEGVWRLSRHSRGVCRRWSRRRYPRGFARSQDAGWACPVRTIQRLERLALDLECCHRLGVGACRSRRSGPSPSASWRGSRTRGCRSGQGRSRCCLRRWRIRTGSLCASTVAVYRACAVMVRVARRRSGPTRSPNSNARTCEAIQSGRDCIPGRLGVGLARRPEHRDEDLRLAKLPGVAVPHRHRLPGVVDEQILARTASVCS